LWPTLPLLQADVQKNSANEDEQSLENDLVFEHDVVESLLTRKSREKTAPAHFDEDTVKKWLIEETDEQAFRTDEEIIQEILQGAGGPEEIPGSNEDDDQGPTAPTVSPSEDLAALTVCLAYANETGVDPKDIFTLKRLQEQAYKESFRLKKQTKIDDFFGEVKDNW